MKNLFVGFILIFVSITNTFSAFANEPDTNFAKYMLEWREKSELAQDYLRKGEQELKVGSKYRACINQRLASKYGVEAFEALIMAQQYNDTDKELDNIEESLYQWKKLSKCNTANSLFY